MDADLFLQQFGHLAQGEGGIKKLRDVILQLAVQGKLVEQNPADEPAEMLLKEIQAEKKRLKIKNRLSKTQSVNALLTDIELPFNWTKTLLGNVVQIIRGITFPAQAKETIQTGDNIACLRTANVQKEVEWHDLIYVSKEFVRNEEQIVQPKDILISLANSRELVGKTAIIKQRPVEATLGGFIGAIRPILIEPDFVNFFLCAPYVRSTLIADANQTTNIANISGAKLNVVTIPLPPLAEQKRIVTKVDELMALCDKLEAEQKVQLTLKTQAVQSTLHHLTNAESPASFGTSLNILERTFGNWFDDRATVKYLRATILQLAVQGKLVPQNPTDEPASELLKRIEAEKKRLVKEGALKKQKQQTPINRGEIPESFPSNWQIARIGTLFGVVRGGSPRPAGDPKFYDGDIPFLKVGDVTNNKGMYLSRYTYTIKPAGLKKTTRVAANTLMLSNSGATLGVPTICTFDTTFNDGIAAFLGFNERTFLEFSYLVLKSKTQWFLEVASRGQGQPNLNTDIIADTLFPLPPLAEQKRIVAKVDELMTLCDQLEAHITHTQMLNTHLMDSLIHRMTQHTEAA